jgi:TrmH family RNA methyltransferase
VTDDRHSPTLTSPSNPRIRAVAALRDPAERRQRGLTVVDGAREVRRALDAGVDVVEAYVCTPLLAGPDARAALDALDVRGIVPTATTEPAFAKIAFGDRAEGIVLVIRPASRRLDDLDLPSAPLLVVLEGVEKPGNLGAVLRSADGAGADAVIAASPRTDLWNPNVIRASAGTVFSVPVAGDTSEAVLAWLRARRIRILATRVDAGAAYDATDLRSGVALVFGAEDRGLSDAWTADDIEPIRLPMRGVADSLNVSVTAAIVLYEARRQRSRSAGPADSAT